MVYSGIAPPPELLAAMSEAKAGIRRSSTATSQPSSPTTKHGPTSEKLKLEMRTNSGFGAGQVPPTPIDTPGAGPSTMSEVPARPGVGAEQQPPMYSDAPPSYEDAVATNVRSVEGPRPEYAPPPAEEDEVLRRDEKKGWVE